MALNTSPDDSPRVVLVVDDIAENRDLLRRGLERVGHAVIEAADGAEALDVLAAQPVDLVLLDIMMPGVTGYEVLERVKDHAEWSRIPIVVVSALDEIESVVRCIGLGATDYLHKPINRVLLRARVDACLEQKRLRDQEQRQYQALEESEQRLRSELAEAAAYVRSLLPAPLRGAIRTDWEFIPSTALGGDAFGYHELDADQLALYMLDVCGHGVGAALLAVSIVDALRPAALGWDMAFEPSRVLATLNERFAMEEHNNMYFTAWYGVYRRSTRELVFANGGHPPAVLVVPGNGPIQRLTTEGIVVGAWPEARFETGRCHVEPGSQLYLFSDGAYEVTRAEGIRFDHETLVKLLRADAAGATSDSGLALSQQITRAYDVTFEDDFSVLRVGFE
jgi:sigma-B regulation protein RsbU (phosphoserine phosphatase)